MLAHQLVEQEEENGKVTVVVTIDEDLLRRIDASSPELASESIMAMEVEGKGLQQPGELLFTNPPTIYCF